MNLDLAIAISAACFIGGLFIGVLRGWQACNKKWFAAERRGEQIEGPTDEFGNTPAYRVRRADMMPIDFVPASGKTASDWKITPNETYEEFLGKCERCESEEARHSE